MATPILFYRWLHTSKCRKAQKVFNGCSNDLNRALRGVQKADKQSDKNLITNASRALTESRKRFTDSYELLFKEHESCTYAPFWGELKVKKKE